VRVQKQPKGVAPHIHSSAWTVVQLELRFFLRPAFGPAERSKRPFGERCRKLRCPPEETSRLPAWGLLQRRCRTLSARARD